jgi:site-specific DNA-cytosine methylase
VSDIRFAEVCGFGSGFALGAVQVGLQMVAKCERYDAFGASNAWANRALLGDKWELQVDRERSGSGWDPVDAEIVLGNPPCAAFSTLNRSMESKGADSSINWHMHALIEYAARIKPQIVIFESVQGALRQGLPLMNALHAKLEALTGLRYSVTHVLHNNLSLGGCAMRRRYFLVLSRVPFGVELPDLAYIPTADDALHDLENLALTWNPQPYRHPPTRWSRQLRSPDGLVDGHQILRSPGWERALWVARNLAADGWYPEQEGWPQGAALEDLCREHFRRFGRLPGDPTFPRTDARVGWQYMVSEKSGDEEVDALRRKDPAGPRITREEHLRRRDFTMGPTQLNRWRTSRHAYVITGGALTEYVHPHILRTFTHREAARIMGFPDAWKISPQRWDSHLSAVWGKGVPVHSGRWIADWARRSLEGEPGTVTGRPETAPGSPDGARVIDVTAAWKQSLGEDWRAYMDRTREFSPKSEQALLQDSCR